MRFFNILKNLTIATCLLLPSLVYACGNFNSPDSGCSAEVRGVQTEAGTKIEITMSGINWYADHVCDGTYVVQFAGSDLQRKTALSIGIATYMSGRGPVFFRCSEKLSNSTCACTSISIGIDGV